MTLAPSQRETVEALVAEREERMQAAYKAALGDHDDTAAGIQAVKSVCDRYDERIAHALDADQQARYFDARRAGRIRPPTFVYRHGTR